MYSRHAHRWRRSTGETRRYPGSKALPQFMSHVCINRGMCVLSTRTVWFLVLVFGLLCRHTASESITSSDTHTTSNRKNWRLEQIGDSGTKPVILKYCRCTTYCKHLAIAGEITQQESWLYDELALLSFHRFTHCNKLPRALFFMFLCNNYRHFPWFWDQLYGPIRLGLSTEVRLWSQFHIWFNWRVSKFFGC